MDSERITREILLKTIIVSGIFLNEAQRTHFTYSTLFVLYYIAMKKKDNATNEQIDLINLVLGNIQKECN
jgi:hypothetical protein